MRTLQFYLLSIYYIVISSLVNIKFVRDLVVRVLAFTCVTVIHFTGREKEEIHSLFSAIAASVFFLAIMETINYINCKAKAKLFLRMACTKIQERQLFNLLDTVPDKVLICSQRFSDSKPTLIYANRQIKQFYGGKIEAENEQGKVYNRLGLQIFQEQDQEFVDSVVADRPEKFSLNDILIRSSASAQTSLNSSIDGGSCSSIMRFQVVRSSNQYEVNDVGSEQKRAIVEIKILDVLYDN